MIRFFYNAGSAQTNQALTEAIRQDLAHGRDVLLLVPEQQTVSTERRMLEHLPAQAQLHFEVVNFSRLANRVFRMLGGHSWNTVSPAVRAILMWSTLHDLSPLLSQYGDHAREARFCEIMLETAKQCKAYHISPEKLSEAAQVLPKEESLCAKISDLALILSTFESLFEKALDNADEELDRLVSKLQEKGSILFQNTHIYVDSFTDFTGQETEVLKALMKLAPQVSFTFPMQEGCQDGLHLHSTLLTHAELRKTAEQELGETVKREACKPSRASSAREYIVQHLFDMNAEPAPLSFLEKPDVHLTLCADPFAEAEAAAARIHALVRGGCRYRDIAVVLRDANQRCGILDAALEREGIPFFLSEKTDITVRPLIKMILLALRICLHSFRDEDVVSYLKTGLCGVDADDVNMFESYVAVWHPRGEKSYTEPFTRNPDGYTTKKSARASRILEGANRAREIAIAPLLTLKEQLEAATNATQMCRAIFTLLSTLSVSEQLKAQASKRLSEGERRDAQEISRLWTITVQTLDDVARALQDKPLTPAELWEILKLAFSHTDIGTIPTSSDEVMIGSASMLRADCPRYVLILGLNEGEFPANVGEEGLITQSEKERLKEADPTLILPNNQEKRASDELFYLYRAFCAPQEELFLYYTRTMSDGRAATPSIAVERVCQLMHGLEPTVFERQNPLSTIYTPAAALDRLCELHGDERQAVTAFLQKEGVLAAANLSRQVTERDATLSPQKATRIFDGKDMTPSHLESFASCRFAYYCEKILNLQGDKSAELELLETGNFLHYVLENVIKHVRSTKRPFTAWAETDIERLVKQSTTAYRDDLVAASGPLSARANALLERLCVLARLVVSSLFEEFSDSDFVPVFTEFSLKAADCAYKLAIDDEHSVSLSGKVDRIDIWRKPSPKGETFVRVVDYKTGTRKFSPKDIANGVSLQMPLYLLALTEEAHPILNHALGLAAEAKLSKAGVTYFSTATGVKNTPSRIEEKAAMKNVRDSLERSGVILSESELLYAASHTSQSAIVGGPKSKSRLTQAELEDMLGTLKQTVKTLCTEMKNGIAYARPNPNKTTSPCDHCKFAAICRVGKKETEGEASNA